MNEEIKIERVSSLQTEERSHLEKIAEIAIERPLLKGEEFFPKHKLETPERRSVFIRHYIEKTKNSFYDYLIKIGDKIMGYAAIDKGYNALKELFTPTVHFAFVHPLLNDNREAIEEILKKECDNIDTANKSGRYQIPF